MQLLSKSILNFLEKFHKEGKTIIMVTHDPNLAREHAKTIYSIKDGRVEGVEKKVAGKWKKIIHNECN